jgi:hypothetical protein
MTPPIIPREVVSAEARRIAEDYNDWDTDHALMSYSWDGSELSVGLLAVIDLAIEPNDYPKILASTVQAYLGECPDDSPAAYLLQFEGFGAFKPADDASEEEKRAFAEAWENRTLHELPNSIEYLIILVADVYGRVWTLQKNRATGEITEKFHHPTSIVHGIQAKGLRSIALATGMVRYGLIPGSSN